MIILNLMSVKDNEISIQYLGNSYIFNKLCNIKNTDGEMINIFNLYEENNGKIKIYSSIWENYNNIEYKVVIDDKINNQQLINVQLIIKLTYNYDIYYYDQFGNFYIDLLSKIYKAQLYCNNSKKLFFVDEKNQNDVCYVDLNNNNNVIYNKKEFEVYLKTIKSYKYYYIISLLISLIASYFIYYKFIKKQPKQKIKSK